METELRILMLEDQEDDAGLIDHALKKERIRFTRKRVDTRDEFVAALSSFHPDIIISDHSLPQFNSIEAFSVCQSLNVNAPFLLVTGSISEEFAVSCLKRGVDDYILKTNLSRLPLAIANSLQARQYKNQKQASEEKLQRQFEELVKINNELDSFVYSISHNLRSPLSSVLGLIGLGRMEMSTQGKNFNASSYFDKMEQCVNKLDYTLREILTYSQNARSDLHITPIDLRELVNECLDKLDYLLSGSNVVVTVDLQEHVTLHSDRQRLITLLVNLLANAIKFRDGSKKTNTIVVRSVITPLQVTIEVVDNGVGIHPHYLPKAFDMFFRASEKSDGAGLGLYIVKEIVAKLHGTVTLHSQEFVETLVRVTLPNELRTVDVS